MSRDLREEKMLQSVVKGGVWSTMRWVREVGRYDGRGFVVLQLKERDRREMGRFS